jgi:hypothetical protein
MLARSVKLGFVFLALCLPAIARTPPKGDKENILARCEQFFGPTVDAALNLYEANSFYVLQANFDTKNKLERLRIVPKYYFDDEHPDWTESKTFEYLSSVQYQNLLTRTDLIRPRGKLVTPPPPVSVVTNLTAWETSIYENARFTVGILVDLNESDDAPVRIKWFRIEFGELAKKEERELLLISPL